MRNRRENEWTLWLPAVVSRLWHRKEEATADTQNPVCCICLKGMNLHPSHGTHLGLEPTHTPKARAEMAVLSVVHGQTGGSFNPSLSPGLSTPLCTHPWSSWLRSGLVGRTPQEHVLRLGVRVLEACQSNRPRAGLRPGPRGKLWSISVATGLVLVLAWEPAHCTLPSSAGVGVFRGNHGNAFVSQAEPRLCLCVCLTSPGVQGFLQVPVYVGSAVLLS